jgi:hypothetical protein
VGGVSLRDLGPGRVSDALRDRYKFRMEPVSSSAIDIDGVDAKSSDLSFYFK